MGATYDFEPEKLIIGVIYHDKAVLDEVVDILVSEFGEWDAICPEYSFSKEFSNYYDAELGGEGIRRIYSFKKTVAPEMQAEIKEFTNGIEKRFSDENGRKINLDPGFINSGRFMLATTKDSGFRVPLKRGIYTELTLFWARGEWHKFPWTYRDYQTKKVQDFLASVRKTYLKQRKNAKLY